MVFMISSTVSKVILRIFKVYCDNSLGTYNRMTSLIFSLLAVIAVSHTAHAQLSKGVDSLKLVLSESQNDSLRISALIELSNYFKERQIDTSEYYLLEASRLIDTTLISEQVAQYYYTRSKLDFKKSLGDKAILNGLKALNLLEDSENQSLVGDVNIAISKAYFIKRDYDEAHKYGLIAQNIGIEIKDSFLLTGSLDIRANIMRMLKSWDESIDLFNQAAEINKAMGREGSAARNLANIATVYSITKKYEKSKPYFKEVIDIAERIDDPFLEAFSLGNLGMNYVELNQVDSAEMFLQRALEKYAKMNNQYRVLRTTSQLSRLYMGQNEFNRAIDVLEPAYQSAQGVTDLKLIDDLAFNLGDSYEGIRDYKNALKYHRIHMELQDSMLNNQVTQAVSEAEAKYETEKKEAEIERLNLEDDLNQVRLSRQRLALGGTTVGLGLLSFLLYRLFGQKRQIESQNEVISTALTEKETLLKEIHHRVKNNMQVISSLLRIQSNQTQDAGALEALKEGQSRVQSMSLIHQDLYQHDNLTGIYMPDYIEKLGQSLLQTYQLSPDQVHISTDIDELTLDVDTVVPLGLIINELVTNSLKYAFPDGRSGDIRVTLAEAADHLQLVVSDDGVGMSTEEISEGYGSGLIRAFAQKLDADIEIESIDGTTVSLSIRDYHQA